MNKRTKNRRAKHPPAAKQATQESQLSVTTHELTHHQGPIPSPDTLKEYELIVPGAAERIIVMAEKEQGHRHVMEQTATSKHFSERRIGQVLGIIAALAGFTASTLLGLFGADTAASIVGGGTLVGIVSVFVTGRMLTKKSSKG